MKRSGMSLITAGVLLAAGLAWGLEPKEQLQFADGLYSRGLWEVALKEYQTYLAASPSGEGAMVEAVHYRMGECWRQLGKADEAESAYSRAYAESAAGEYHFRAGLRRAELMEAAGRLQDEVQLLTAMVSQGPSSDIDAACRYALGNAQVKAGQKGEGAETYAAVLKAHPGSPYAGYAALALAGLRQGVAGQEAGLEALYLVAVSNPASARVGAEGWFQLGDFYFRGKRFEQSARAYEKLAALYPADERVIESRMQMAWAFHHAGLYADALPVCDRALASADVKNPAEWLYIKANCERQLVRNEAAVNTYAALIQKYPQAEMADYAAYERSLTFYKMGDFSNAVRQARSLNLTPRIKKDVYWLLAEGNAALGDEAGAVQYYRLLTTEFPASELAADALYRLGHLMQKRGELRQAAEVFGQLAADYPKHELAPQALFAEASCLGRAKQNEDAVVAWAKVIEKYPDSKFVEESLYQKAMVEVFLRRDEQARGTLGELLARFPGTRFLADAQFWMGVLLEEQGKWDESERAFRKSLESKPSPEMQQKGRFRLGLVLQRKGMVDEAAGLFQLLMETSLKAQFTPELLEWLAEYHLGRKQFVMAGEVADALMARGGTDSWKQIAWAIKGKAALGQGRPVLAREAFESAVGIEIKGGAAAESRLRLGDLRLAAGEVTEAKAEYERAAGMAAADSLLSVRVHAYAGIAKALKAQGNLGDAARHFLSVAVLFDDPVLVPECLDEAAEAFAKAGRKEESDKVVKELLDRYPDSDWAKKRLKAH